MNEDPRKESFTSSFRKSRERKQRVVEEMMQEFEVATGQKATNVFVF